MIMFQQLNRRGRARERAEAIDSVVNTVVSWPSVIMAPHQFDAVEFQLDGVEFGHLHRSGRLEIPLVHRLRDALVHDGLAEVDPWIPTSGWITHEVNGVDDVPRALFLLRISYLYRVVAPRESEVEAETVRNELAELEAPGSVSLIFDRLLARRFQSTPQ